MYHIFATQVAMRMFRACHKFVVMPMFSADNLIDALKKYQVNIFKVKVRIHPTGISWPRLRQIKILEFIFDFSQHTPIWFPHWYRYVPMIQDLLLII